MPPARSANKYSLVADIGGTNTRVALADGVNLLPDSVKKYRNAEFTDLDTVLRTYVAAQGKVDCGGACIAVAGPVRDGIGELTNLDWKMDHATLATATGAETVSILNDLQAQGHALGYIPDGNLRRIIPTAPQDENAACLVIGVGTGFNAAPVYSTGKSRLVVASEAGHVNLPIQDETDLELWQYLDQTRGFPSVEDALSGRGLEHIYQWQCTKAGRESDATAAQIFAGFEDGTDEQAMAAAGVFCKMLGTVAGNLALIHLPFGGIYLAGGVARAFAPHLQALGFAKAFRDKGRFAEFLDGFGVCAIEDDFAALSGCAHHLAELS